MTKDEATDLDTWAAGFADSIGRRVGHYRRAQPGLTAAKVCATLATLGVTMNRTVLSNLENGHRRAISVAEWVALAAVLRVPPLLLLLPIGTSETVELPAGHEVDTWRAAQWFMGSEPAPGQEPDDQWRKSVDLLNLYAEHAALLADRVDDDGNEANRSIVDKYLRRVRRSMRDRDILLPTLPPNLAYLDSE